MNKKILLIVLAMLFTIFIAGCAKNSGDKLSMKEPVPSGDSGNISGLVFTVLPAKFRADKNQIYYYRDIKVTATPVGGGASHTTFTKNDGVYLFANLPNGKYNLQATLTIDSGTYTGTLNNVEVRGGITTYMANFIVFDHTKSITYTGKVTDKKNGNAIEGANVSIELSAPRFGGLSDEPAYQTDHYQAGDVGYDSCYDSIILTTTTDAGGMYSFTVPQNDGSTLYFLSARYKDSMVYEIDKPTELVNNFSLQIYEILDMPTQEIGFACAYTLKTDENLSRSVSANTNSANTADLLSVWAKANKLPSNQLAVINKMKSGRAKYSLETAKSQAISQSRSGSRSDEKDYWVEIDLMWDWAVDNGSAVNVYGYNIYRSSERNGTYYKIAAVQDPFQMIFYDIDPTLDIKKPMYYTVTSFGAFNKESVNSIIRTTSAFEPLDISISGGDTITSQDQKISWNRIDGANSYTILIYQGENMPMLNVEYIRAAVGGRDTNNVSILGQYEIGGGLPDGTYWIAVIGSDVAVNKPALPSKLAYSGFKKIVIKN